MTSNHFKSDPTLKDSVDKPVSGSIYSLFVTSTMSTRLNSRLTATYNQMEREIKRQSCDVFSWQCLGVFELGEFCTQIGKNKIT
jgi:hypothetical protein